MADGTQDTGDGTVSALIRRSLDSLSTGERKVGRAILAHYPIAGLETVAELSQRAGVSPPTVVRFVTRLGFSGYPALQKRLVREVQERLGSPLEQYELRDGLAADGSLGQAAEIFSVSITATIDDIPQSEFERAVSLLADPRHRIRLIGGRFSRLLADYLAAHLMLLRADAHTVGLDEFSRLAAVTDTRRGDVLVVFDYRRYDQDVVRFARRSAERGAEIVLFTDRWLSPASDVAATVLPAHVDSPSPFDSLVPAMAVVETVIAGITDRLGEKGRRRLEAMEALRKQPGGPAD